MSEPRRIVTAEELERFPDDDYRYELVEGRVIRMSPVGYQHGRTVARLLVLFDQHLRGRNLGVVVTEVGFKLASNPDTVRAPDVAFIRQDRIPSPDPRGFLTGPPDLAVEVLSPDDRPSEIQAKVEEYFARGVPLVLVVDADVKTVTVFRPSTSPVTLRTDDLLDLDDVVPGFRCRVHEIFE
jgi:Uma2 family endonuclease